ncbi:MAG: vWA domain-containing protein [Deltaproteobacteria bacterium]|nr:vWA domain-containing protein [Deltaproteobacteria bacterium]
MADERPADGAPNGDKQDPARFDPWSGSQYGGARFFAASTLVHIGLLLLFAGISFTVIKTAEKINVKIVEPEVGVDAANSMEDYAGLLEVTKAPQREAQRPQGPVVKNVSAPRVPTLGNIGPKLGTKPVDLNTSSIALGSGGVGGLGGTFGEYIGGLRKVGLDLVLVIDSTESMQFVIDEVKENAAQLVRAVQRMVPTSRVGVVVYRDQGDEYVTKWSDLSFRTDKLTSFISNITASGGGDWEEAVLDGVDAAMHELSWRKKSKKIIILIGGSPPHPEDVQPLADLIRKFRQDGGSLSTIDVTDHLHLSFNKELWKSLHGNAPFQPPPKPEFYQQVTSVYGSLAKDGGGDLVQLADDKALIRDVLILTFGTRWKTEMAPYMKELS